MAVHSGNCSVDECWPFLAALRSVEQHLGLEKLYVLGTNCGESIDQLKLISCTPGFRKKQLKRCGGDVLGDPGLIYRKLRSLCRGCSSHSLFKVPDVSSPA